MINFYRCVVTGDIIAERDGYEIGRFTALDMMTLPEPILPMLVWRRKMMRCDGAHEPAE